jgi:hypothetical protein
MRPRVSQQSMQIFPKSANAIARASIVGGAALVGLLGFLLYMLQQSPYVTQQKVALEQPVPFSHQHHVAGLGIDCRYCHTSVETSNFAGIPPVSTCMNCHKEIWTNAAMLEPVRESFRSGRPIVWSRVHRLPDYVHFNHSIHVKKGIGCETCHGAIDTMNLVYQASPLTMSWCLDCHRAPEKFIRPRSEVFTMNYVPEKPQSELGPELVKEYGVRSKTHCSACHY